MGTHEGRMKTALSLYLYQIQVYILFSNLYKLSFHSIEVFVCNGLSLPFIISSVTNHCFFLFNSNMVLGKNFSELYIHTCLINHLLNNFYDQR